VRNSPSPGGRELEGGGIHPHPTSPFKGEGFTGKTFAGDYNWWSRKGREDNMAIKSGKDYIESLRKLKPKVYAFGERVERCLW